MTPPPRRTGKSREQCSTFFFYLSFQFHTSQRWCWITSRCHFEYGYIRSCNLPGPIPFPLQHSSGLNLWLKRAPTKQSVVLVEGDTDRKLDFFCSLDVQAYGCSLYPRRALLSITFPLTEQQHKAIRAVSQMNVIHTQHGSELQSDDPRCHF